MKRIGGGKGERKVFTLTRPEAEYCLRVCELAAQGTSGSDLSNTFRKLHTRLEAELHKTANLDVSLSAEEKNELVKAVMICELLVRENMMYLRSISICRIYRSAMMRSNRKKLLSA